MDAVPDQQDGVPMCELQISPTADITKHANYNKDYDLQVVVCSWKQGLIQLLSEKIEVFMSQQLLLFQSSTILFNVIVYITILYFFERKLSEYISKPI